MIVPMRKIYLVARSDDRQQLLETLRELGVLHLVPVDPQQLAVVNALCLQPAVLHVPLLWYAVSRRADDTGDAQRGQAAETPP